MCRDGRRLACRALERRHIGRRCCLRVRRDVVVGDLELAHGKPPVILFRAKNGTRSLLFPDLGRRVILSRAALVAQL